MTQRYTVVTGRHILDLVDNVRWYSDHGWEPVGGATVYEGRLIQTMWKAERP